MEARSKWWQLEQGLSVDGCIKVESKSSPLSMLRIRYRRVLARRGTAKTTLNLMWHRMRFSSRSSKLVGAGAPAGEDAQIRSHLCAVVNLVFDDAEKHDADGPTGVELRRSRGFPPSDRAARLALRQGFLHGRAGSPAIPHPVISLRPESQTAPRNARLVVTPIAVEARCGEFPPRTATRAAPVARVKACLPRDANPADRVESSHRPRASPDARFFLGEEEILEVHDNSPPITRDRDGSRTAPNRYFRKAFLIPPESPHCPAARAARRSSTTRSLPSLSTMKMARSLMNGMGCLVGGKYPVGRGYFGIGPAVRGQRELQAAQVFLKGHVGKYRVSANAHDFGIRIRKLGKVRLERSQFALANRSEIERIKCQEPRSCRGEPKAQTRLATLRSRRSV